MHVHNLSVCACMCVSTMVYTRKLSNRTYTQCNTYWTLYSNFIVVSQIDRTYLIDTRVLGQINKNIYITHLLYALQN